MVSNHSPRQHSPRRRRNRTRHTVQNRIRRTGSDHAYHRIRTRRDRRRGGEGLEVLWNRNLPDQLHSCLHPVFCDNHLKNRQGTLVSEETRRQELRQQRTKELNDDLTGLEQNLSKLRVERDMTLAEVEELSLSKR